MEFRDLRVGQSFTTEDDGGLFVKTKREGYDNTFVVVRAVGGPVPAGEHTTFGASVIVLKVTEISYTYQKIETKISRNVV